MEDIQSIKEKLRNSLDYYLCLMAANTQEWIYENLFTGELQEDFMKWLLKKEFYDYIFLYGPAEAVLKHLSGTKIAMCAPPKWIDEHMPSGWIEEIEQIEIIKTRRADELKKFPSDWLIKHMLDERDWFEKNCSIDEIREMCKGDEDLFHNIISKMKHAE